MSITRSRTLTDRALGLGVLLCLLIQPLLVPLHLTLEDHSYVGALSHEGAKGQSLLPSHAHGHCHCGGHAASDTDGDDAPTRQHPAEDHLDSDGVERTLPSTRDALADSVDLGPSSQPAPRVTVLMLRAKQHVLDAPPRAPTRARAPSRAPPALS